MTEQVCNESRKTSKPQHINHIMNILMVMCGISPTWHHQNVHFSYVQRRLSIQDQRQAASNIVSRHSALTWSHAPMAQCTLVILAITSPMGPQKTRHARLQHLTFWGNTHLPCYSMPDIFSFIQNHCTQHTKQGKIGYVFQLINPLKTKRRLLYLKTQFIPRSKHFPPRL